MHSDKVSKMGVGKSPTGNTIFHTVSHDEHSQLTAAEWKTVGHVNQAALKPIMMCERQGLPLDQMAALFCLPAAILAGGASFSLVPASTLH